VVACLIDDKADDGDGDHDGELLRSDGLLVPHREGDGEERDKEEEPPAGDVRSPPRGVGRAEAGDGAFGVLVVFGFGVVAEDKVEQEKREGEELQRGKLVEEKARGRGVGGRMERGTYVKVKEPANMDEVPASGTNWPITVTIRLEAARLAWASRRALGTMRNQKSEPMAIPKPRKSDCTHMERR
jgi:hypothetical protein